jgi:hypothetical protein
MGFQILDVRNSTAPVKVGSLRLRGEPYNVAVQGNHAHIASGPEGLVIVDISQPEKPKVASTFPVEDFGNAVAVSGSSAHISDGKAGVTKVNISNPAAPKLEAVFDTPGESQGVVHCVSLIIVPDSDSLIILKQRIEGPEAPSPEEERVLGRIAAMISALPQRQMSFKLPGRVLLLRASAAR